MAKVSSESVFFRWPDSGNFAPPVNLTSEHSFWLLLPALLVAAAISFWLYKGFPVKFDQREKTYNLILGLFRTFSITLILILLLNPLLRMITVRVEKPTVILALDQSKSIISARDSSYIKSDFIQNWNNLISKLSRDYQVRTYALGSEALLKQDDKVDFKYGETDLSALFTTIRNSYDQLNLGAVVIASDGIYNKGTDPVSAANELKVPVYAVGLGDTIERKDILIYKIRHNEIAFAGNRFPVEIEIESKGYAGKQTNLVIERDGKIIYSTPINFNADGIPIRIQTDLPADQGGVNHYIVRIAALKDELTYQNNTRDFFIDVIDGKQKVLLIYHAPHPDIAAIKNAVESDKNMQLTAISAAESGIITHPEMYNLIIYHQVPSALNSLGQFVRNSIMLKIPSLYIVGSQTQMASLNLQQNLINIASGNAPGNDAVPMINKAFGLFTLSEEEVNTINNWPPLSAPFGNYMSSNSADILMNQQVGYVNTNMPLIIFSKGTELRTGIICGEGIWKWRIHNYANKGNTKIFDGLIHKMIQYLSLKEDKRPFRISGNRKFFAENENIRFDAELHNESFELINTPEVAADLTDEKGKKYHYIFSRTSGAYTLDAGLFPPGNYALHAYTNLNGKSYTIDTRFSVLPLQNELTRLTADHGLLRNLSATTGGVFYNSDQLNKIVESIKNNELVKPVRYQDKETHNLIHYKLLFFMILIFLSTEWLVRKFQGAV